MFFPLLMALSLQAAPSLETPGIILLIMGGDTVFMTPTSSIDRAGNVRSATMVQIYPLGPEGWETVRQDTDLEIDCERQQIRVIGGRNVDAGGQIRPSNARESSTWEALPDDFPPLALLHAVTCSDVDLATVSVASLEAELPRLRARLH